MRAVTAEVMRRMDQRAIEEYHIPSVVLMEHAALCLCEKVKSLCGKETRIHIVCGAGNNGGDGFALARLLVQEGYAQVEIYCAANKEALSKDAFCFAQIAQSYDIPIYDSTDRKEVEHWLKKADLLVDGLFGTGLSRPIGGWQKELIGLMNASGKAILAIDIASGIHSDSGQIMGCAVKAKWTVSFEAYKIGQLLYPGAEYSGEVEVAEIAMPKQLQQEQGEGIQVIDEALAGSLLPKRKANSHKGSYGKCLMIAGSLQMHGAMTLCARAALSSGIGTLTLFVPEAIAFLAGQIEEAMLLAAPCDQDGFFAEEALAFLKEKLSAYDMVVIGNGIGRGKGALLLVQEVLSSELPCILDGDALYLARYFPQLLKEKKQLMLTPHPKELSYLSGCSMEEIAQAPLTVLERLQESWKDACIVAKNTHTLLAYQEQRYINIAGNNALAKGGSGDVLCGVLAGLYGQGKDMLSAAVCAVYLHAKAAERLAAHKDMACIQPHEVLWEIQEEIRLLRGMK